MSEENWVAQAEAALDGRADEGVTVLSGQRPPVLDADGAKAVLAPFLAALVWGAAIFREMVAGSSLDPLGIAFRILALGLTLRVVLLGWELLGRFQAWWSAHRYGLALTEEGLLYRTPTYDVAVPKDAVVAFGVHGRGHARPARGQWALLYVVTDPASGRSHLALPPVFGEPSVLHERLHQWRGAGPEAREVVATPAERGSELYDRCVAGLVDEGVTVLEHGLGWLRTGPYAPLLVGVVAMDAVFRAGPSAGEAIEPWVAGLFFLAILAVPVRWFWTARREVSPRKGISLILTPAEALMRPMGGVLRVRWKDVVRVSVDAKKTWSVLEGAHFARHLVLTRSQASPIRYEEPYLGVPAEVAELLAEAYRAGRLPLSAGSSPAPSDEEE